MNLKMTGTACGLIPRFCDQWGLAHWFVLRLEWPRHLMDLNEGQKAAVEYGIGVGQPSAPLLIIPDAGTGKTKTLAHRVARLVLNGTDPQRAATVRNILHFPKHFSPPATVVTLEQNYRSTQPILDASTHNKIASFGKRLVLTGPESRDQRRYSRRAQVLLSRCSRFSSDPWFVLIIWRPNPTEDP